MWHCISNVITVYLYDPLSQGILSETAPDVVPRFYMFVQPVFARKILSQSKTICLCVNNKRTKKY